MLDGGMNYSQISKVLKVDRSTLTRYCNNAGLKKMSKSEIQN